MKKTIFMLCALIGFETTTANVRSMMLNQLSVTSNSVSDNFPSTQWSDFADTSWYVNGQTQFTINTAEQLAGLSLIVYNDNNLAGVTITLDSDIDLSGHLWTPIGYNYYKPFKGSFDGNGKTISNLFVYREEGDFLGLFGEVNQGEVRNLYLNNAKVKGKDTAGSIVGNLSTNSLLENCHAINVDIEVVATQNMGTGYNAGGLCGGVLTESVVDKCSAQGKVKGKAQIGGLVGSPWDKATIKESFFVGEVEGENLIGGFFGFSTFAFGPNREVTIENCYTRAVVQGIDRVGGFVGTFQNGIIRNCYAVSTVESQSDILGSFAAEITGGQVFNSYYDNVVSSHIGVTENMSPQVEITGKTTSEMKTESFITLLNQNNTQPVWFINPDVNLGYPSFAQHPFLSTDNFDYAQQIKVYPTLASDVINIESTLHINSFTIYDYSGKVLKQGKLTATSVDVSDLNTGIYILNLEVENSKVNYRIFKQ
ncbi:MAG: GLUG motif-containing protein [Bacteroidota bacterium]|nr:GLUG motif-containing protein [Bacteroidota bacterium]